MKVNQIKNLWFSPFENLVKHWNTERINCTYFRVNSKKKVGEALNLVILEHLFNLTTITGNYGFHWNYCLSSIFWLLFCLFWNLSRRAPEVNTITKPLGLCARRKSACTWYKLRVLKIQNKQTQKLTISSTFWILIENFVLCIAEFRASTSEVSVGFEKRFQGIEVSWKDSRTRRHYTTSNQGVRKGKSAHGKANFWFLLHANFREIDYSEKWGNIFRQIDLQ